MKKLTALLLALVMALSLAACGSAPVDDEPAITRAAENTEASQAAPSETSAVAALPTFVFDGVQIVPGTEFDASKYPEALSTYSAPSCAIDGSDNTYSYEGFELVTMDDGKTETVYSIFLMDSSVSTAEGLTVGDKASRAAEIYGEDFSQEGAAYIYTYENGLTLSVLVQGDVIASIELFCAI